MQKTLRGQVVELVIVTLVLPAAAIGQEPAAASVHWVYSAYFGTGWYRVVDDRDVFAVRMTPRWTLSEPSLDGPGKRSVGTYLKVPVSVGLDRFSYDDVIDAVDVDNVASISGNPEVDRPVSDQWEFGAAIRRRDSTIPIWFLEFDMLGLGYRFSSNGNLKGITFVFRSVFDD